MREFMVDKVEGLKSHYVDGVINCDGWAQGPRPIDVFIYITDTYTEQLVSSICSCIKTNAYEILNVGHYEVEVSVRKIDDECKDIVIAITAEDRNIPIFLVDYSHKNCEERRTLCNIMKQCSERLSNEVDN